MKILHIDSSISGDHSVTRALSADVMREIKAHYPQAEITYRDVVRDEINHLTADIAAGFRVVPGSQPTSDRQPEHQISQQLVDEFLAHDLIVIAAPMYNFSVSSQLKAWLDRLAQPGKTFQYTATGPVGLAEGKQVLIISARGGFYLQPPFDGMDFQEKYLRAFFGFLGIDAIHIIRAEGTSKGNDIKHQQIAAARSAINNIIAALPLH